MKNWTDAAIGCTNEEAILTEPRSYEAISVILESINLNLGNLREEVWVGGRKAEDEDNFQWTHHNASTNNTDTTTVDITSNWALQFPNKGMQHYLVVYTLRIITNFSVAQ